MLDKIKEEISCVFDRDPAAQSVFEVVTTYPGVHALMIHHLAHFCWLHKLRWFRAVYFAHRSMVDWDRNTSWRANWSAFFYRSWNGGCDW